jgi:hypothetical protein
MGTKKYGQITKAKKKTLIASISDSSRYDVGR